jgi:hypothetical protein
MAQRSGVFVQAAAEPLQQRPPLQVNLRPYVKGPKPMTSSIG